MSIIGHKILGLDVRGTETHQNMSIYLIYSFCNDLSHLTSDPAELVIGYQTGSMHFPNILSMHNI